MGVRLGEVMVRRGILTEDQVQSILREQAVSRRPFGELAEELFGVCAKAVEQAWAAQYEAITEHVDPRDLSIDRAVLCLIDRRQAWQFRILPVRRDGRELMVATVTEWLPRALRFSIRHFVEPCYFVLARPEHLGEALMTHFPMEGMTPESISSSAPVFGALRLG